MTDLDKLTAISVLYQGAPVAWEYLDSTLGKKLALVVRFDGKTYAIGCNVDTPEERRRAIAGLLLNAIECAATSIWKCRCSCGVIRYLCAKAGCTHVAPATRVVACDDGDPECPEGL